MGIGFRNDLEGPRPLGHSLWPFLLESLSTAGRPMWPLLIVAVQGGAALPLSIRMLGQQASMDCSIEGALGPFVWLQRSALQQALPRVLHESWSRCPLEELEMFLRPLVVPSAVPCSAAQARSRAESAAMQSRAGLCRLFLFMGLALQAPNLVCSC